MLLSLRFESIWFKKSELLKTFFMIVFATGMGYKF